MGARLKFWRRSRVPKKGSRDEAVEIFPKKGSRDEVVEIFPKKGSRDEAVEIFPKKGNRDEVVEIFLAASPLVTAPPSNLTRLYYNGSAGKSHSTTTQYRQLRRLQ